MEYTNNNLKNLSDKLTNDLNKLSGIEIKKKYLGKKGLLTQALKDISEVKNEEKAIYGKEVNSIKKPLEEFLQSKEEENKIQHNERIDPTAPCDVNSNKQIHEQFFNLEGSKHPLTKEVEQLTDIFKSMGFSILESRQIDNDFNMFQSLNFPKGHPARDMYDTFRTEEDLVLPAHTSKMQNRALRKFGPPPIAVVLPGRCFRNEATDAGHEHTFHQIEGIYVDKNVSVANMIATIKTYLERYLETELEIRIQPAYFPFTEPSAEMDIQCQLCGGRGCNVCKYTGWLEILGCGMVDPNVLAFTGLDPEKYTGYAFGMGIERIAMLKYQIRDLRLYFENDIRFLDQFRSAY